MKQAVVTGMLLAVMAIATIVNVGCGGAGKPPLQPDSDGTSSLGDGGPEPAAATSAQPAVPAPPR